MVVVVVVVVVVGVVVVMEVSHVVDVLVVVVGGLCFQAGKVFVGRAGGVAECGGDRAVWGTRGLDGGWNQWRGPVSQDQTTTVQFL